MSPHMHYQAMLSAAACLLYPDIQAIGVSILPSGTFEMTLG